MLASTMCRAGPCKSEAEPFACPTNPPDELASRTCPKMEKSLARVVAVVCVALLVRLVLPERQRWWLDATAQDAWHACKTRALKAWRWPAARKQAARMTEDAIQRARNGVERDGNVYRPKSFRERRDSGDPREPRKPH